MTRKSIYKRCLWTGYVLEFGWIKSVLLCFSNPLQSTLYLAKCPLQSSLKRLRKLGRKIMAKK